MAVDITLLHDELANDPAGLGYKDGKGVFLDAQVIADKLNAKTNVGYSIDVGEVDTGRILAILDISELIALSAGARDALKLYLGRDTLNISNPNILAAFQAIFNNSPVTRGRINNAAARTASRAEVLFKEAGVIVEWTHVVKAEA